jgi:hypothetical protein
VRVGKSLGAYTAVVPRVRIIVASADASYAGWAGTEMLFHESSHALILQVRTAIDQAMSAAGKRPRDLWHVVLFYVAGEITRQTLAARGIEYQTVPVRQRLVQKCVAGVSRTGGTDRSSLCRSTDEPGRDGQSTGDDCTARALINACALSRFQPVGLATRRAPNRRSPDLP